MKTLRKVVVSVVLGGILVFLGVSVTQWLVAHRPKPARTAIAERAPLVDTVTLEPRSRRETIYGFGTARAIKRAVLRAEVAAPVVELVNDLRRGMAVERSQALVRLDDSQYRHDLQEAAAQAASAAAQLAQLGVERENILNLLEIAEADLKLNKDELDRVQGLHDRGIAPKTELDDARLAHQNSLRAVQTLSNQISLLDPRRLQLEAAVNAAEARADRARLNIDRCTIAAPFDARIESLAVQVGDRVQQGGEIAAVVNLDIIEIPLELPVSTRPRVRDGAGVELFVESMPEIEWTGHIRRISPIADEQSRTFQAYVEYENEPGEPDMLPGYFLKAEVEGPEFADALVVPRSAIVEGKVYVLNDNHAHLRAVAVERWLGDDAVVIGDVQPGDRVITTNLDLLYDKAPVRLEGQEPTAVAEQEVSTDGLGMAGPTS